MRLLRTLAWIELKLFLREPLTVVFAFALPVIFLFVMGEVFGVELAFDEDRGNMPMFRGVPPLAYYVPGYVAMVGVAIGVITLPAQLASYRERGMLRRLRVSSFSPATILGAQVLVTYAVAAVGAVLVIVAAYSVYEIPAPDDVLGALVAFIVATAAFAAVGVLLGALMPSPRAAQGAGIILFFLMMMLSGTGPPVEVMTGVMRRIGEALPLQHAVVALQDPWLGFGWSWMQLGVLAAIAAVCGVVAVRLFRWE